MAARCRGRGGMRLRLCCPVLCPPPAVLYCAPPLLSSAAVSCPVPPLHCCCRWLSCRCPEKSPPLGPPAGSHPGCAPRLRTTHASGLTAAAEAPSPAGCWQTWLPRPAAGCPSPDFSHLLGPQLTGGRVGGPLRPQQRAAGWSPRGCAGRCHRRRPPAARPGGGWRPPGAPLPRAAGAGAHRGAGLRRPGRLVHT